MSRPALLIEIGCEEIPARMIQRAAKDLQQRVLGVLRQTGLEHGAATAWGGPRRLAVRVEDVQSRQPDRDEQLTGPSAKVAFDAEGKPTPAALGFARKQGIEPGDLQVIETDKGDYVGVRRSVAGRDLGSLLAESLPPAVSGMSFPKTMRWAEGVHRWVRPVHRLVVLHGTETLPVELFGVKSERESAGHRFLHEGAVTVTGAEDYESCLESARVLVDPARRRAMLDERLRAAAAEAGGVLVDDPGLLDEVADLVEWPGVVSGSIDEKFLALPREILITTLRYHQKCFSVQSADGTLLPAFLAIANTDQDPAGHVRRGNEWVVGGRLEDAEFFWAEDLERPLAERLEKLSGVGLHPKLGSYAEKAQRMEGVARRLAAHLDLGEAAVEHCAEAAKLAKADLVTGTVGEFPELQGRVGGLMLAHEGRPTEVSDAVYEHYQPAGPGDDVPSTVAGAVVSLADRLDALAAFVRIGEAPTGSRDPFGLRRAVNGVFRIAFEKQLAVSLDDLCDLCGGGDALRGFLRDRLTSFLRDSGYSANEISAVARPQVDEREIERWKLPDIRARLEAISRVRGRDDFRKLVELTERVQNILRVNGERVQELIESARGDYEETEPAARELEALVDAREPLLQASSEAEQYGRIVEILAELIDPVDAFFTDALVINAADPDATVSRFELLGRLRMLLTRYFDITELAGEADRRK